MRTCCQLFPVQATAGTDSWFQFEQGTHAGNGLRVAHGLTARWCLNFIGDIGGGVAFKGPLGDSVVGAVVVVDDDDEWESKSIFI